MVDAVLLSAELASGVKALVEVGLNRGWSFVLFVLRQPPSLTVLEGRHGPMEPFVRSYEFGLRTHKDISVLRVDLH